MNQPSLSDFIKKLEHYCAYQERCHQEVKTKLYQLGCFSTDADEVIYHLITNNYLNEQRFANIFALSKFNQKQWGRYRIEQTLKSKGLSERIIQEALNQISEKDYQKKFLILAQKIWFNTKGKIMTQRKKTVYDKLIYKGYERELIHQFLDKH